MAPQAFSAYLTNILPPLVAPGQGEVVSTKHSATDAITAHAGGGQANGVLLTSVFNRITVVGTAGDSVKMPAAKAGLMLTIANADSTDSANVFPASGEKFNEGSADAAFALAANKRMIAFCVVDGTWSTILTA